MAYSDFAYLYDDLNAAADYDTLTAQLIARLRAKGILGGIVADLGCGTGEVSLRMAAEGYDMIAVDASEDMLAVFREKLEQAGDTGQGILLLCQRLEELDLYGTINAAVATFDTFNHLPPQAVAGALRRAALFMEPGGILLFDANTPFKHRDVLASNQFSFKDDGLEVTWQNRYMPEIPGTEIRIEAREDGQELFSERFIEYEYDRSFWRSLLADSGFGEVTVEDGESFGPLLPNSQRFLFCARKL